jgi:tRNA-modifying protein YgfZ
MEAVLEDVGGRRLPAWYGRADDAAAAIDREYEAARQRAAVVDLADRGVLAVTGPLRQQFLHSVLSNDVASLQAGQGCLAALMDVKGRLLALMRVLVGKDVVRLETSVDRLDVVEKTLTHYRVAAPVRFAVEPSAVLGLVGPRAREVLAGAGIEIPPLAADSHVLSDMLGRHVWVARASDLPAGGLVVHVDSAHHRDVWEALVSAGATPLGRRALDVLRIEDGRPWYGVDVTEENLLHESGLLSEYHSSTKGCYVGQEVVARLEGRGGHVNKALRGLCLSSPASPGAAVTAEDGRDVGRLTTAAVSPRLGPIALGYVHRSHFSPGTEVRVDGQPATVAALPFSVERCS